jgi:hypothetical protein
MTSKVSSRPARVPNHPPIERIAHDIDVQSVKVRFTGTREQAQAILDEIDRQANEIEAKTEKK